MTEIIDVLMPIYRSKLNHLASSIKSVQNQSVPTRLICILNGMQKPLNTFYEKFLISHGVDLILMCPKKGVANALNFAIPYIRSDYIARQDDDDISHPFRLELILDYIKSNCLDIAGCNINVIDSEQNILSRRIYPAEDSQCKTTLVYKTCFCHPSILMKASVLKTVPYPITKSEDYALWLKLSSSLSFGNLQLPLYYWRKSPGQASSKIIPYLYLKKSMHMLMRYTKKPLTFLRLFLRLNVQIVYTLLKRRQIVYSHKDI